MFEVKHRTKLGFRLKDVYHADAINRNETGYDVVYYFHCKEKFGKWKERTTLLINLTMEEDELLQSFNRSTRKAIHKAMRNQHLELEITENPGREEREQFRDYYKRFSRVKEDWYPQSNFFNAHLDLENLVIVKGMYREKPICQFTYIPHGDKVLGAFGATVHLFSNVDEDLQNIISDAHRLFDYKAMLYFKSQGHRLFDYGGLVQKEGSNVDQYKLGFGGFMLTEYSFMYPLTAKGRLFCWAKEKKNA